MKADVFEHAADLERQQTLCGEPLFVNTTFNFSCVLDAVTHPERWPTPTKVNCKKCVELSVIAKLAATELG